MSKLVHEVESESGCIPCKYVSASLPFPAAKGDRTNDSVNPATLPINGILKPVSGSFGLVFEGSLVVSYCLALSIIFSGA